MRTQSNFNLSDIDPLTGGTYMSEMRMYGRVHGLSFAESELVVSANSHRERDAIFCQILQMKAQPLRFRKQSDAV